MIETIQKLMDHKPKIQYRSPEYRALEYIRKKERLKKMKEDNGDEYHKHLQRKKDSNDRTFIHRREYQLKKKYNISIEKWNKMFEEQKGYCYICGIHQIDCSQTLCVDHNHITGEVRKLLCSRCNVAIGMIQEDKSRLEKIKCYLEEHNE